MRPFLTSSEQIVEKRNGTGTEANEQNFASLRILYNYQNTVMYIKKKC
jgi:hypothetical protein